MTDERSKKFYEEAQKHGFSRQDVDSLKNFSTIMASSPTKKYLLNFVNFMAEKHGVKNLTKKDVKKMLTNATESEKKLVENYDLYTRLTNKIGRAKSCNYTGFGEMSFEVTGDNSSARQKYCLRYQLSIVPHDHKIVVRCPVGIVKNMMSNIDKYVDIETNFYKEFIAANGLLEDLAAFAPDVDISALKLDEKNRTMFLTEDMQEKIGILCFYVDEKGKPIVEK